MNNHVAHLCKLAALALNVLVWGLVIHWWLR